MKPSRVVAAAPVLRLRRFAAPLGTRGVLLPSCIAADSPHPDCPRQRASRRMAGHGKTPRIRRTPAFRLHRAGAAGRNGGVQRRAKAGSVVASGWRSSLLQRVPISSGVAAALSAKPR